MDWNTAGFTLFETLAATMILATALVVVLQLFSGGLQANHLADQYTKAVFHAREKMEEILLSKKMGESVLEGQWEDGFGWQAAITLQEPEQDTVQKNDLGTFQVKLEVNWTEGTKQRKVELCTIALAKKRYQNQE
jgi:type II secretory pathway pseudopilin PulG